MIQPVCLKKATMKILSELRTLFLISYTVHAGESNSDARHEWNVLYHTRAFTFPSNTTEARYPSNL